LTGPFFVQSFESAAPGKDTGTVTPTLWKKLWIPCTAFPTIILIFPLAKAYRF